MLKSGSDNSGQQKSSSVPNVAPQNPVQIIPPPEPSTSFPPRPVQKQPLLNIGSQQPVNPRFATPQFGGNRMPFQRPQPTPPRFMPPQQETSFETFPQPIRPVLQSSRPALLNSPPRPSAPSSENHSKPTSQQVSQKFKNLSFQIILKFYTFSASLFVIFA
jgi:hypothetical protein